MASDADTDGSRMRHRRPRPHSAVKRTGRGAENPEAVRSGRGRPAAVVPRSHERPLELMPSNHAAETPATPPAWVPRIRVRSALRGRILLFTVLPVVTLVTGALWMVNRNISRQVQQGIRDNLLRASAVLENMLGSESRQLSIHGRVIARDPHFLSVFEL